MNMIVEDGKDSETIRKIAKRAVALAKKFGHNVQGITFIMDVSACHLNGTPLKLEELLATDDGNFGHDVFGINRHLDRNTGELTDCFLPRFAKVEG